MIQLKTILWSQFVACRKFFSGQNLGFAMGAAALVQAAFTLLCDLITKSTNYRFWCSFMIVSKLLFNILMSQKGYSLFMILPSQYLRRIESARYNALRAEMNDVPLSDQRLSTREFSAC